MRLTIAVVSALSVMPLVLLAAPGIGSGTISFAGSIVEAGCAVETAGSMRFPEFRRLRVVPGVEVDVSTFQNACGRGALPLSATFESLHSREIEGAAVSGLGVVTVAYQ